LFSFNMLTFFVLYEIRLCRWFITEIMKGQCFFDKKSLKEFGVKSGTSEISQKALSNLLLVRLIGKRTEIVGKLIFFPFIIWFLLFISRHYYFDNWRNPLGLAIVISMSALLAWTCAFILRQSAESLRAVVIDRLTKQLDGTYAAESLSKIDMDRIQYVLKEVKDIKTGAFASYIQQPALQSLLVPLGGISGMKILELLANLG
jgi:hypothetical protein